MTTNPSETITITTADLQEIKTLETTLQQKISPHIIELSDSDKALLPKMGDAHLPFVVKAFEYAQQNPNLVPAYLNIPELKTEANAVETLRQIYQPLKALCDMLNNTITVAGSDAYVGALSFYSSVKDAAKHGVPGAQTILDDLGKHFASRGKRTTKLPNQP